jgi:hypothetical protein
VGAGLATSETGLISKRLWSFEDDIARLSEENLPSVGRVKYVGECSVEIYVHHDHDALLASLLINRTTLWRRDSESVLSRRLLPVVNRLESNQRRLGFPTILYRASHARVGIWRQKMGRERVGW